MLDRKIFEEFYVVSLFSLSKVTPNSYSPQSTAGIPSSASPIAHSPGSFPICCSASEKSNSTGLYECPNSGSSPGSGGHRNSSLLSPSLTTSQNGSDRNRGVARRGGVILLSVVFRIASDGRSPRVGSTPPHVTTDTRFAVVEVFRKLRTALTVLSKHRVAAVVAIDVSKSVCRYFRDKLISELPNRDAVLDEDGEKTRCLTRVLV